MKDRISRVSILVQSIRLCIYLLIVLLSILSHLMNKDFFNWDLFKAFYTYAALGIALNLFPFFNLKFYFQKNTLVFLTLICDLILISLLLNKTQLNQAIFLFMYLVVIFASGFFFQLRGGLIVSLFSSICFTWVSLLGPEIKGLSFLFLLLLNNAAFIVVAILSGYLSEQLEEQGLSLKSLRKINEIIVKTIPSGLITFLADGTILKTNPASEKLLIGHSSQKKLMSLEGQNLFSYLVSLKPFFQDYYEKQIKKDFYEINYKLSEEVKDELKTEIKGELKAELKAEIKAKPSVDVKEDIKDNLKDEFNSEFQKTLKVQLVEQKDEFIPERSFLAIIEDLSEIKKMEFSLRQSEKLAAVGQLAAGIAHEIRNPLAGISGSIELLSQQSTNEDDKRLTNIILREISRLNNLISEFLDFARPENPPITKVKLSLILKEVLESIKYNQKLRADVVQDFKMEDLPFILGNADKLKQALLNIVINSYQAMESSEKAELTVRSYVKNENIYIKISDTGTGIKEATKQRIFEPFHTTKPKGTGLGLAITHKILEVHNAKIEVESKESQGTMMTLVFPLTHV